MKKILTLVLTLAMLLSLAACGAKEDNTPAEADKTQEETATPETPAEKPEEKPAEPEQKPEEKPAEPEQKPEEKPAEPETPAVNKEIRTEEFYQALCQKYGENFPANMPMDMTVEMLDMAFPGLYDLGYKQLSAYQPMMGAVVCEIVLVEVKDSADVETVKTMMENRIAAQIDGGAWYPASIEGWELNSRIAVNGNYLMMIAYEKCDEVVDAFNALFA